MSNGRNFILNHCELAPPKGATGQGANRCALSQRGARCVLVGSTRKKKNAVRFSSRKLKFGLFKNKIPTSPIVRCRHKHGHTTTEEDGEETGQCQAPPAKRTSVCRQSLYHGEGCPGSSGGGGSFAGGPGAGGQGLCVRGAPIYPSTPAHTELHVTSAAGGVLVLPRLVPPWFVLLSLTYFKLFQFKDCCPSFFHPTENGSCYAECVCVPLFTSLYVCSD